VSAHCYCRGDNEKIILVMMLLTTGAAITVLSAGRCIGAFCDPKLADVIVRPSNATTCPRPSTLRPSTVGTGRDERDPPIGDFFQKKRKPSERKRLQQLGGSKREPLVGRSRKLRKLI